MVAADALLTTRTFVGPELTTDSGGGELARVSAQLRRSRAMSSGATVVWVREEALGFLLPSANGHDRDRQMLQLLRIDDPLDRCSGKLWSCRFHKPMSELVIAL